MSYVWIDDLQKDKWFTAVPHFGAPEMMKSFESTAEGAESAEMLFIRIVLSGISACSAVR
jgi:hypothetical protein